MGGVVARSNCQGCSSVVKGLSSSSTSPSVWCWKESWPQTRRWPWRTLNYFAEVFLNIYGCNQPNYTAPMKSRSLHRLRRWRWSGLQPLPSLKKPSTFGPVGPTQPPCVSSGGNRWRTSTERSETGADSGKDQHLENLAMCSWRFTAKISWPY